MHRLLSDAAVTRSTGRDEASSGGLDPPLARRSVVAGADNVGDGTVLRAINCYRDLQRRSDSADCNRCTCHSTNFNLQTLQSLRDNWTGLDLSCSSVYFSFSFTAFVRSVVY